MVQDGGDEVVANTLNLRVEVGGWVEEQEMGGWVEEQEVGGWVEGQEVGRGAEGWR